MKNMNNRGVSLTVALIIIIMVAGIAMSLTILVGSFAKASESTRDDEEARNLAVSVVEKMRMYLYNYRKNGTWTWDEILTYCDNALTAQGFNKTTIDAKSNLDIVKTKFDSDQGSTRYKSYLASPDLPAGGSAAKSKVELDATMTTDTWNSFLQVPPSKTSPGTPMVQFNFNMPIGGGGMYYCFIRDNPDDTDITTGLPDANMLADKDRTVDLYVFMTLRDGFQKLVIARMYYQTGNFAPLAAVTTGKTALYAGSSNINGTMGSVISNEDIIFQGNTNIEKTASANGTISYVGGTTTIGGAAGGPGNPNALQFQPEVPLPDFNPATDLKPLARYVFRADGTVLDQTTMATIPAATFNSWGFTYDSHSNDWTIKNAKGISQGGVTPEVAYYFETNLMISSNNKLNSTLMTEQSFDVAANGDITGKGVVNNTALIAYKDINLRGTPTFEGVIIAREQVSISGNVKMGNDGTDGNPVTQGSIIALDKTDSPGSIVQTATRFGEEVDDMLTGNAAVHYDGNLDTMLMTEERVLVRGLRISR